MAAVRIVTVTLNPAVDHVLEAEQFSVGSNIRARRIGWHPAGKGINVARVIATLGSRCVATGFVGRDDLVMFEEYLERVGSGRVVTQLLVVRGRTRSNITIMDPVLDTETHIRDEGFTVQHDDVRRILSKVAMLSREDTYVVLSGSLPPGVTLGDFRSMLHYVTDQGARAVVDTADAVLEAMKGESMWLAKLNAQELATLSGMVTDSEEQVIAAARTVCSKSGGSIEYVIATRGASGAVLIGPDIELTAQVFVHPGLIANTVGCGDALLAGVLHQYARSGDWAKALRHGVAAATAAAVSREPGVFSLDDVHEFWDAATVEQIGASSETSSSSS